MLCIGGLAYGYARLLNGHLSGVVPDCARAVGRGRRATAHRAHAGHRRAGGAALAAAARGAVAGSSQGVRWARVRAPAWS